jgi:hypothetical protein
MNDLKHGATAPADVVETTAIYSQSDMKLKEEALAKTDATEMQPPPLQAG